jgi:hypothetical protein
MDDREREEEALAGLAIAEGTQFVPKFPGLVEEARRYELNQLMVSFSFVLMIISCSRGHDACFAEYIG